MWSLVMRRIYCGSWPPLEKSRYLLSSSLHFSEIKKTLKAPSSVTNSPVCLCIRCSTYSSGSSHPPADEGMIRRGWRKTATVVSAFMTGTKSLYKDVKSMYELKRRHRLVITGVAPHETGLGRTDFKFNRAELQFIYQTQKDLRKMLPTIALFFIPVLGYIVPFIVFMYPHHMLSHHFLTEDVKTDVLAAATKVRVQSLHYLLSDDHCQETSEQWKQMKTYIHHLVQLEEVHQQDMTTNLRNVRGQHLERLCGMWGVSAGLISSRLPWMRATSLRLRLESHLHYIFTADWLVKFEGGLTNLPENDLNKLYVERCLLTEDQGDLEKYLHTWIHVSTQFSECPLYLMAHLPLLLASSEQKKH